MKRLLFNVVACSCLTLTWISCNEVSTETGSESGSTAKSAPSSNEVAEENPVHRVRYGSLLRDRLSTTLGITVEETDDVELFKEVAGWVGTPYKSAGTDKNGADCSGFVNAVYQNVYNIALPRQTSKIYESARIKDLEDIKSGDLVFFRTDGKTNLTPNYLGIYLKENRFAILSSKGFGIVHIRLVKI